MESNFDNESFGSNDNPDNWTTRSVSVSNDTRAGAVASFAMDTLGICMFATVIAGVPGNLLVVAVYARKLTSSVRMYMFALALTDVMICISYAATSAMGVARKKEPIYGIMWSMFNFGVEFSLFVLTLTAVERYWSIARPHSFTFSPRRGKVALVVTALVALATLVAIKVLSAFGLTKTAKFYMMLHLGFCTLVILVMYTLLARELLLRLRRRKTQLNPSTTSNVNTKIRHLDVPLTSVATTSTSLEPPTQRSTTGPSTISVLSGQITKTAAVNKQTQEAKAALMLFVVTAAFLACWIPVWLQIIGVYVPRDILRVYVIQSVVNPAIYGCMSRTFRDDVRHFFAKCRH